MELLLKVLYLFPTTKYFQILVPKMRKCLPPRIFCFSRRDAFLDVAGKTERNAMRIQDQHGSCGSGNSPEKIKIISNQEEEKQKEITVDNIKNRRLIKRRQCAISWTENHVRGSRNRRNQKQIEGSVGSVPQVSTRTYLESLPTMSQTTSFQHGDHTNNDIRKWNVDIIKKT